MGSGNDYRYASSQGPEALRRFLAKERQESDQAELRKLREQQNTFAGTGWDNRGDDDPPPGVM